MKLVADGVLSTEQLVEKICLNPAKIAGITDYERIGGAVLIDPHQAWTVTKDSMLSAGKNTPFGADADRKGGESLLMAKTAIFDDNG